MKYVGTIRVIKEGKYEVFPIASLDYAVTKFENT